MITQDADMVFERGAKARSVSVVVPLYNYQDFVEQTLDTVAAQTLDDVCLIVVNDASKDDSLSVAKAWMDRSPLGAKSAVLLNHKANAGLSVTRNTGIAFSGSEFCFFLDSDNLLYPTCLEKHARALASRPDASAAYSSIQVFDAESGLMGTNVFNRDRLKYGNYIDAMAMVRRDFLIEVGGYRQIKHGWEDYDLWLRICEHDSLALHIPEVLSRYRVHGTSMLRTQTNIRENLRELYAQMNSLHPWLELNAVI